MGRRYSYPSYAEGDPLGAKQALFFDVAYSSRLVAANPHRSHQER